MLQVEEEINLILANGFEKIMYDSAYGLSILAKLEGSHHHPACIFMLNMRDVQSLNSFLHWVHHTPIPSIYPQPAPAGPNPGDVQQSCITIYQQLFMFKVILP